MTSFTLVINLDNAAFEPDRDTELARILEDLADRLRFGVLQTTDAGKVRDVNGNTVGDWVVTS